MSEMIKNQNLWQTNNYIKGKWQESQNKITVTNPYDQSVIGEVSSLAASEMSEVIDYAESAQKSWAKKTAKERAKILMRFFHLIMENQEDLAKIITLEQGKPLPESMGEIAYAASFIEWYAEEGKRIYGDILPPIAPNRRLMVTKEPVGVVAAITPWNFPSAMITRKCSAALAAGCSIIIKPAAETPYSALALAYLAEQAGLNNGELQVVNGEATAIGQALCSSPKVRKLSFTGSTEVGQILMRQSADTLKKLSLELGGHAPFIVCEDANIEEAIEGAIASKYRNSGQTCVCANRFYVHKHVADEFIEKLSQKVKTMKIGSGFDDNVFQGPLINEEGLAKVKSHVDDALEKGATLHMGGKPHALGGQFFEPTILSQVNNDMLVFQEETFGPVTAIQIFEDDEKAITAANDSPYGLAAYVYTQNMKKFYQYSEGLAYGMVGVNVGILSTETAPFGGIKNSGFGREGSYYGIDEYLHTKYTCIGI